MSERTDWSDSRLDQLELTVRAFAPTAVQLGRLEANQEALERKVESGHTGLEQRIDDLKGDVHESRKSIRNTLLLVLGPVATTGVIALGSFVVDRFAG